MTSSELPRPHTSGHREEEPWKWVITGQSKQSKDRAVGALRVTQLPGSEWMPWYLIVTFICIFLTSKRVKTLFPTLSAFGMSSFENWLFRSLANIWLSISACFFLADFGDLCHRYSEYLLSFWEWEATAGCTLTLLARKYRPGAGVGEVTEDSRWVETDVFEEN